MNDYQKHQEALARQLGGHTLEEGGAPTVETMRVASGIEDEELLGDLIALGIRPESLMLMSIAPLVAIAWADGEVQPSERTAILGAAGARGIVPGTMPYSLLETWLTEHPGEQLLETWETFVKAVIAKWDHEKADRFKEQIGGMARRVAGAAGGFLGVGSVSASEAALIGRIEAAFDLSWR